MAKILLLVAQENFQTKEYHDTRRMLEEAGHVVVTGSNMRGAAYSNAGDAISADIALSEIRAENFDAIFTIGGPGALSHLDNEETLRIMREAKGKESMSYGGICISPRILAKAGVLTGLHATGWNNDGKLDDIFAHYGVLYEEKPVVVDGRVVTAEGPLAAEEFGRTIAHVLLQTKES